MLILVVSLIWGLFYYCLTELIQKNTQAQMDSAANQIMKDLGDEFYNMEQITFTLSQNESVKAFVTEHRITEYFLDAKSIEELLFGTISNQSLIGSVITFNNEGVFYRFRGTQGNTACERIYYLIRLQDSPEHLIVTTNNMKLIGYGSGIYDNRDTKIGSVAVFLDEEAILLRLAEYNQPDTVHISVAAKNEIVISDKKELLGMNTESARKDAYYSAERHVGATPFSILITADIGYLRSSTLYFTVAVILTGLALALSLFIFADAVRKHFFRPMLQVLDSVDKLDLNEEPGSLPYVGSAEFDKLVNKLNDLLQKIDSKNKNVQDAMLLVKNTELRKQKALLLSLKKQINAHFTVNILNIIRILITKKELEQAAELCDGLSMLVRYAHNEDEFINIWDEFSILESYINILNIRYKNKFIVDLDLDDRLMDYEMPRMLLQPIVENSVVHGYRNFKNNCQIKISAKLESNQIHILIQDEGEGLSEKRLEELTEKLALPCEENESVDGIENVALRNINRRVTYYYGAGHGVSLSAVIPHGLAVRINLGVHPFNCSKTE